MAAVTANSIIRSALLRAGVLDPIESPAAEQVAVCLDSLNGLIEQMQQSRPGAIGYAETVAVLPAAATHLTVGPGQTIDIPRPVHVLSAFARVGGKDYPVQTISRQEWERISDKSHSSDRPTVMWWDQGMPAGKLYLWPLSGSGVEMHITTLAHLQPYTAATQAQQLPQGLRRVLELALAVDICPLFGVQPSPLLVRDAAAADRAYRRAHHEVPELIHDEPGDCCGCGGATVIIQQPQIIL